MPPGPYASRLTYLFATVLQPSPPNTLGLYRLARKRDRGECLEGLKLIWVLSLLPFLDIMPLSLAHRHYTLASLGYNAIVFGSW